MVFGRKFSFFESGACEFRERLILKLQRDSLHVEIKALQFEMQAISPFGEAGIGFGKQPRDTANRRIPGFAGRTRIGRRLFSEERFVASRAGKQIREMAVYCNSPSERRALWRDAATIYRRIDCPRRANKKAACQVRLASRRVLRRITGGLSWVAVLPSCRY